MLDPVSINLLLMMHSLGIDVTEHMQLFIHQIVILNRVRGVACWGCQGVGREGWSGWVRGDTCRVSGGREGGKVGSG